MAHKEPGVSAEAGIPFLKKIFEHIAGDKNMPIYGKNYCAKKCSENELLSDNRLYNI